MDADLLARVLTNRAAPPSSAQGWLALVSQARSANLAARLARWTDLNGVVVPPNVRWQLDGSMKGQRHLERMVTLELRRVARALHGDGLGFVLLKGAAYLAAGLPPAMARQFGDIDVLVRRADLSAAEAALMGGGWVNLDAQPYDQRYYREWMHEIPPLTHIGRGSVIDLHHTIVPPTSVFRVDGSELLLRAVPAGSSPGQLVLQPVDMVLHSMVHLFTDGEFDNGLRDLLDLWDLLRHFSRQDADFWDKLLTRADALGLARPLHHALHHLERLAGPTLPDGLRMQFASLRPAMPARWLMHWLLSVGLRPQHPACQRWGDSLARWLLYVRSHWLRMPLRLLMPHLVRKAWMQRFPPKGDKGRVPV